jgi:hypothetical protein
MSEATVRDAGGRFQNGSKPGPGRPRGARSRFGEAFIQDLASVWETRGIQALERCAVDEPGVFLRVCASLMPKDLNLNLTADAGTFATNFRSALQLLGNDVEPPRRRPPLPGEPLVLEHRNADES